MEFIQRIGYAVCHQIPERSILIDGKQLPVCARDTGLYIGSLLSLLYIVSTRRRNRNAIPAPFISFSFVFFMLLLAIDGITSYLGIRATTNAIRLATGLLVGIGLPFFMYPLTIDNILSPKGEERILSRWWELAILISMVIVSFLIILHFNKGLYNPLSMLITAGVLGLHFLMFLTLVSFLLDVSGPRSSVKKLLVSLPLALLIMAIEFPLLIKLHHFVER
jgi:uncharacterized membrane protein